MRQLRRLLCGWSPAWTCLTAKLIAAVVLVANAPPMLHLLQTAFKSAIFICQPHAIVQTLFNGFIGGLFCSVWCCFQCCWKNYGPTAFCLCRGFCHLLSDSTTWFLHLLISDDKSCSSLVAIAWIICVVDSWAGMMGGDEQTTNKNHYKANYTVMNPTELPTSQFITEHRYQ